MGDTNHPPKRRVISKDTPMMTTVSWMDKKMQEIMLTMEVAAMEERIMNNRNHWNCWEPANGVPFCRPTTGYTIRENTIGEMICNAKSAKDLPRK